MIHPSLIEKISLDTRESNQTLIDDLKRSYPYVGPVSVTTHAASDPACNVMKLIVRMSKPYWAADEQGAQMWEAVSEWLDGKMYKVGSTMANFNKSREEKGQQTVTFGRLELDMKPYLFGVMLAGNDTLPEAEELVGRFRDLLNAGVISGEIKGVEMPSATSWASQYEAAKKPAEEAEEPPVSESEAACDEEAPEVEKDAANERVIVADVDYRLWDVVFADGTVRQLDSVAGQWM